ncbi:MAG: hypothetical protein WAV45_16810 [Propionibacteriaceae bacterium]|nr:hypothetical protein [Micropruina sp.]
MTSLPEHIIELACSRMSVSARARYRRELSADLASLPGHDRWRFALLVLVASPRLRGVVDPDSPHGSCLVGYHSWGRALTEDGGRFVQCVRCHKLAKDTWWGTSLIGPYSQWYPGT